MQFIIHNFKAQDALDLTSAVAKRLAGSETLDMEGSKGHTGGDKNDSFSSGLDDAAS